MSLVTRLYSFFSAFLVSLALFLLGRSEVAARPADEDAPAGSTDAILKRINPPAGSINLNSDFSPSDPSFYPEGSDNNSAAIDDPLFEADELDDDQQEDEDDTPEGQPLGESALNKNSSKSSEAGLDVEEKEAQSSKTALESDTEAGETEIEAIKKQKQLASQQLQNAFSDNNDVSINSGCFTLLAVSLSGFSSLSLLLKFVA